MIEVATELFDKYGSALILPLFAYFGIKDYLEYKMKKKQPDREEDRQKWKTLIESLTNEIKDISHKIDKIEIYQEVMRQIEKNKIER